MVQATVRLESVVHQLLDRLWFADGHGNRIDRIAKLAQKLGGFGQPLLVATTDDEGGAKLCKYRRNSPTYPRARPRDNCDLTLQEAGSIHWFEGA